MTDQRDDATEPFTQPGPAAATQRAIDADGLSRAAKQRFEALEGRPLLISDWVRALFIHYEVEPAALQRQVPFELDLHGGRAFVSIVAFTMQRLRPLVGGRLIEWLIGSAGCHGFFNVRTYVRHRGDAGIYFLAEWLPNRLAVMLGPRTFGLPYRLGRLDYRHQHEHGQLAGAVTPADGRCSFGYRATLPDPCTTRPCQADSLDAFLLERYVAFTVQRDVKRLFRVWHEPWPQTAAEVTVDESNLLSRTGPWFAGAELVGANYSPGVFDIWISRPRCINGPACATTWPDIDPCEGHNTRGTLR